MHTIRNRKTLVRQFQFKMTHSILQFSQEKFFFVHNLNGDSILLCSLDRHMNFISFYECGYIMLVPALHLCFSIGWCAIVKVETHTCLTSIEIIYPAILMSSPLSWTVKIAWREQQQKISQRRKKSINSENIGFCLLLCSVHCSHLCNVKCYRNDVDILFYSNDTDFTIFYRHFQFIAIYIESVFARG